jgi:hypothetical protein
VLAVAVVRLVQGQLVLDGHGDRVALVVVRVQLGLAGVVGTALDQRPGEVDARLLLKERDVLVRVLLLEGLGGRRDDDPGVLLQRLEEHRGDTAQGLTGAAARLAEEVATVPHRVFDGRGHGLLGLAGLVTRQLPGEVLLDLVPRGGGGLEGLRRDGGHRASWVFVSLASPTLHQESLEREALYAF